MLAQKKAPVNSGYKPIPQDPARDGDEAWLDATAAKSRHQARQDRLRRRWELATKPTVIMVQAEQGGGPFEPTDADWDDMARHCRERDEIERRSRITDEDIMRTGACG